MKKSFNTAFSGFTLIELLVVIGIIGVLSALLLANFVGVRERAADSSKKSNLDQLKKALRLYYNDYQEYPASSSGNGILGCGGGSGLCTQETGFATSATVYMKELPADFAYYSNGNETFMLVTTLENASDESIQASQDRCQNEISEYTAVAETDFVVCQD